MLDEIVGNPAQFGGVQCRSIETQLVDDADEWTGSHRWPDGKDSHANHASFGLRDENRRGGDEEQGSQVVNVVALGVRTRVGVRKDADGGVKIGQTGGADVNLHEGLRVRFATSVLLDNPERGYHERPVNPPGDVAVPLDEQRKRIALRNDAPL